MAGEKLLSNTGGPVWCSVMTQRGGMGEETEDQEGGEETEDQEGGDICVIMADLYCLWQKPTQHCKAIFL